MASSGIADCEKRQRVVGSLSVALVEGWESHGADTNLRFHAASGVIANRELGVVHFWVCAGRPLASPSAIHTFRAVTETEHQVVVLFGKKWEFGDNREVWKAFVCQYAPPRQCCSWGTAEANRCMPAPRRRHWMSSDLIDAEFALRSCQWQCEVRRPNRFFFICTNFFAKHVAIDLKCIENHGGTLHS